MACAGGRWWSDSPAGERRYALICVRPLRRWTFRPEYRASVVVGEGRAHEGQAAFGHVRVQVPGGPVERRCKVPGVHRKLRALPVDRSPARRVIAFLPGTEKFGGVHLELARGVVAC